MSSRFYRRADSGAPPEVILTPYTLNFQAQSAGTNTAPKAFMDLFFDFTGSDDADYPAPQPTMGQMPAEMAIARDAAAGGPGPLILLMEGPGLALEKRRGQNFFRSGRVW